MRRYPKKARKPDINVLWSKRIRVLESSAVTELCEMFHCCLPLTGVGRHQIALHPAPPVGLHSSLPVEMPWLVAFEIGGKSDRLVVLLTRAPASLETAESEDHYHRVSHVYSCRWLCRLMNAEVSATAYMIIVSRGWWWLASFVSSISGAYWRLVHEKLD